MAALPVVVLVLSLFQAAPGSAGDPASATAQQPPAQQPTPQQPPSQQPQGAKAPDQQQAAPTVPPDSLSLERIRRELEQPHPITVTQAEPSANYRVEVQGFRFELPEWQKAFVIPKSPVPQVLGGADHYEMMRLITPPQAWGSAPFSNGDLLKMYALSGVYGLAGTLVKRAISAYEDAAAQRAHEEVMQELADVAEHNARVAAGQTDGAAVDGNPADKKAAAARKKQEEKKKKKDGGV